MKRKILGFFVCMLLIATALPTLGTSVSGYLSIRETYDVHYNLIQQNIGSSCNLGEWLEQIKLTALDGAADDWFSWSVSIDGDYALLGAYNDDDNGDVSGSAYVFKRNGTSWVQEGKLTALDGAAGDFFGFSVSIDGDYALVGAYGDDDYGYNSGSAYVFKRSGATWIEEQKLLASDGATIDYFGRSVSIDGDYALVGAYGDDDNGADSGSAYVFKRGGSSWVQEDKLTASDGTVSDYFGSYVSLSGDYALVGARYDDDNGDVSGSAYVFKRSGTSWVQESKLTASDGTVGDNFGYSVSLSGDYALIGARYDDDNGDDSGSAYVFKRSGATWTEEQKLLAPDGAAGDCFGFSVSIDGGYALAGALNDDSNKGSAYVFKRSGAIWIEEQKLLASDGATGDRFGGSVSIDGGYALAGAYGDDSNKGSAYVFKKYTPDLDCLGSLSWTDISPGATVTGSFMVVNVGDLGSELSWEIESYPTWGSWTFIPPSGTGLTPGMGTITVAVEVVAPNEENKDFTGEVKVINSEDSNDYDTITVSLTTPRNKAFNIFQPFLRFLEQHPHLFPILRYMLGM